MSYDEFHIHEVKDRIYLTLTMLNFFMDHPVVKQEPTLEKLFKIAYDNLSIAYQFTAHLKEKNNE